MEGGRVEVLKVKVQAHAHGLSNSVDAGLRWDLALWKVPEEDTVGREDAPVREAEVDGVDVAAAAAAGAAAVAAGSGLAWERRALGHDDDDQVRDATVEEDGEEEQRWKVLEGQKDVRLIEEDNVDTGSSRDDVARRAAAAEEAADGSTEDDEDESEDAEVIRLVEVRRPAMKKGEGVYCPEVLDPCLVLYMYSSTCTHNQE